MPRKWVRCEYKHCLFWQWETPLENWRLGQTPRNPPASYAICVSCRMKDSKEETKKIPRFN